MSLSLLIGTRKGAWRLRSGDRRAWTVEGPWFLGNTVHHVVPDPRAPGTLLLAARTGHLGPTVFRSRDDGASWTEASAPPAFPKGDARERAVHHTFWLTPGHASESGTWYAGTSPQALFRSEDGGDSWRSVTGWNDHPMNDQWCTGDGTPDGAKMHSILVDPRDAAHLYLSMSGGGTFESLDRGATWAPLNKGVVVDFAPVKYPEFGQDPHCVVQAPSDPDRLYQQNHCGIYRIDRPGDTWQRIGDNMPKDIGDIGFGVLVHPRDADTAWVWPMDGTDVWPRVSPDGRPAAWRTTDGGGSWERQDAGLPARGWFSVKRQCVANDTRDPVGLYVGTSSGTVFASADDGTTWATIAEHLPHIYCVEVVE